MLDPLLNEDVLLQGSLLLSLFAAFPIRKRQTLSIEGTAKQIDRMWSYAMELLEFGLA